MDGLERAGLAAANKNGNRKINLNTPINDNPELEAIRQQLQRDYTEKTEDAASQRRQAEQMMQQAAFLLEQAKAQATGSRQQQPAPQPAKKPSITDQFEGKFGAQLDPGTRQVLGFLEEYFGAPSTESSRELAGLKQQMEQMQGLLQQSNQVIRALTAKPDLDNLAQVFGEDELRKRMPAVSELMSQMPNLGFKQALAAVDPDFFASQMGRFSAEEESKRSQKEQAKLLGLLGGGVEGMMDEPGGEANGMPPFEQGEDFAASVQKMLGENGYRTLMHNAADAQI